MDPIDIALIMLGVAVVFLGLLKFSMHLIHRKRNFQEPDPVDVNDEV
jgi:hypothetical protein